MNPARNQEIIPTIEVAQKMVAQSVTIYNNEKRHCSNGNTAFAHWYQKHDYKFYKKLIVKKGMLIRFKKTEGVFFLKLINVPGKKTN
jgi:hypothetical protein